MRDAPSGVLISYALLRDLAEMATCAAQNGDFKELARMADNSLPGLPMPDIDYNLASTVPAVIVPSGVPMRDTLDRIPGAEPQFSTDAASLAPLTMIGQVGLGPELFRTPLIMIDNRMWMTPVVYLVFMNNRGDEKAPAGPMDSTNGVATAITTTMAAEVKIMYWNIFHNFTLNLTSPGFRSLLTPLVIRSRQHPLKPNPWTHGYHWSGWPYGTWTGLGWPMDLVGAIGHVNIGAVPGSCLA
ncbi:hypothetical protein DFH09DRAFT_1080918 [Mycena vulgaris]|nr:hypothetical protein DFH09DRAFT_1080918 [Mycena vulgaris]